MSKSRNIVHDQYRLVSKRESPYGLLDNQALACTCCPSGALRRNPGSKSWGVDFNRIQRNRGSLSLPQVHQRTIDSYSVQPSS